MHTNQGNEDEIKYCSIGSMYVSCEPIYMYFAQYKFK